MINVCNSISVVPKKEATHVVNVTRRKVYHQMPFAIFDIALNLSGNFEFYFLRTVTPSEHYRLKMILFEQLQAKTPLQQHLFCYANSDK